AGGQEPGGPAGRQQRRRGQAHPRRGEPAGRGTGGHDGRSGRPRRAARGRSRSMSIWLNENSKVIVQGMTGSEGSNHTRRMLAAGTNVVGGVTPKKGGQTVDFDGTTVPVFDSVADAMAETGADVSVIFVPAKFAKSAMVE